MGIYIDEIRIKNFRSLEDVDVKLGEINILIGQNNSGKSNFLKAIEVAFNGSRIISEEDIFINEDERLSKSKEAIIDLKIKPSNGNKYFDDFWTGVFTENWISVDDIDGSFVGIRTIIHFDIKKNDYVIERRPIKEWDASIADAKVDRVRMFTSDMYDYINSFYMDAQRDIISDLRDKKSYFGRATSNIDLSDEQINELEKKLSDVNQEVIGSIAAITETNRELSKIISTLGNNGGLVQIEPLTRKINDLHRGMDITYKERKSASFSVSQHGMGTRSWVSFLTLGSYVEYIHKRITEEDNELDDFVVLSLEEPEAHLHPQAQRQIYKQLADFKGQKMISTHSSSILAQADLGDIVHFKKRDGKTCINRFNICNYDKNELAKIRREVVNLRGELIFSTAVILCEGITEEQALPVYFKEFFGIEAVFLGINIIGIAGQNYKTYLKFFKEFDIAWYIFSDGEEKTINNVKKAIKIFGYEDIQKADNVVVIENGFDYEKMLIKNNSSNQIVDAINEVNEDINYYDNYKKRLGEIKPKRAKTNKPKCPKCHQDIYEDVVEDGFSDFSEDEKCLYKCMTSEDGKAKYSLEVAKHIVNDNDLKKRFPNEILKLLIKLEKGLGLERRREYSDLEFVRETK
ncbi:MAG: DUF2813 domain-containing protein [Erysipelotrichaceae bacterium]|nr:DUF2813 domain-containing protein [Lachnospiraceae bacterium]MBE6119221.1 DUF2813 domain-containing protein [Erysipelotrichaceae bacterium]